MRKISRELTLWLLGNRRKISAQRRDWKRYRRHVNRYGYRPVLVNKFNPEQKPAKNQRVTVELPERLDLEDNYDVSVTALLNVRLAAKQKFKLAHLSFEKLRYISPSAALLLASEIDRWKGSIGDRVRANPSEWDPNIRQLLCEMGFGLKTGA